jgi:pyruvate ferredoxin oxidoreductase alpha subunit
MKDMRFINGDEAVALGAALSRPEVIAAYPITPQTIVVEKLSEYVDTHVLDAEYIQVESEHSALAAAMGASAMGVRTFTATSSQGLLYMCEVLHYVPGSRFPIVMMNANRALAAPWSIYGDQSDSMAMLNSGWMQVYVETAQEALDMIIQAYKIAENDKVMLPIMVNLDGFILTHTYELVDVPEQQLVDSFLPAYETENKMNFEHPKNLSITVGPDWHTEFRYQQHITAQKAIHVIEQVDAEFYDVFGRKHGGMMETYQVSDAEAVLITLGSITSTARDVVDAMRAEGKKVGLLKMRFIRPFPEKQLRHFLKNVMAVGVLEKDISYGYEGTLYTNVCSALCKCSHVPYVYNFIAGLSGHDISADSIRNMFIKLLNIKDKETDVDFVDLRWQQ